MDLAATAGFEDIRCNYFNTLLFPAIAAVRIVKNTLGLLNATDDALPPSVLNLALANIFAVERYFVGRLHLPFGTSLVMTARNPQPSEA